MLSRFPFVVVPTVSVGELHAQRPALCLAVLTAASFEDIVMQRELGLMFNDLVSSRLLQGTFSTLELLQALLVALAWYVWAAPQLSCVQMLTQDALKGCITSRDRDVLASTWDWPSASSLIYGWIVREGQVSGKSAQIQTRRFKTGGRMRVGR